jgi:hypothetical protein
MRMFFFLCVCVNAILNLHRCSSRVAGYGPTSNAQHLTLDDIILIKKIQAQTTPQHTNHSYFNNNNNFIFLFNCYYYYFLPIVVHYKIKKTFFEFFRSSLPSFEFFRSKLVASRRTQEIQMSDSPVHLGLCL